jgi:hypothetical protein
MSDEQKLRKMMEVAICTAAADGLERGEVISTITSIMPVIAAGETIEEILTKSGVDIQEDIDFALLLEMLDDITEIIDSAESISLDESYMQEASDVIGSGVVINNMTAALCNIIAGADGFSEQEAGAIMTVYRGLQNLDQGLTETIAEGLVALQVQAQEELGIDE